MFDKERLMRIPELDEVKTEQMDESQLNAFATTANSLIDNFPSLADNAKTALETKDIEALTKLLTQICGILRQVYADKLADDCQSEIETLSSSQYEEMQAFVVDFMKNVSALSIDLQMAKFIDPTTQPSEGDGESAATNTILAVDDRHFFLTAIKTMLQGTGYKATCVNSGEAALKFLKNHRAALFILDIEMPGMDGYELAKRIRESGQAAPIIFLTGNANKDSVVRALQAGAADFIIKPITKDQLLERIGRYITPELAED